MTTKTIVLSILFVSILFLGGCASKKCCDKSLVDKIYAVDAKFQEVLW